MQLPQNKISDKMEGRKGGRFNKASKSTNCHTLQIFNVHLHRNNENIKYVYKELEKLF